MCKICKWFQNAWGWSWFCNKQFLRIHRFRILFESLKCCQTWNYCFRRKLLANVKPAGTFIDKRRPPGWSLTCAKIPQVVGFNGFLVPAATGLPIFDLVSADDAVVSAAWRRLPWHFDALKNREERNKPWLENNEMIASGRVPDDRLAEPRKAKSISTFHSLPWCGKRRVQYKWAMKSIRFKAEVIVRVSLAMICVFISPVCGLFPSLFGRRLSEC